MKINIKLEHEVGRSIRIQQLEAMFSVPAKEKLAVSITGDIPIENRDWNIGLIVGPSGSGKTVTLNKVFGEPTPLAWTHGSVVDDFDSAFSMGDIATVCQSVGFNTIPAWMRPFSVLSNGERFRVELARRLMSSDVPITIDEFTSVVDRQVAKIGAFAVAKYIRQNNKRLVAASCHYDIIDWLEPDWIFEPAASSFSWRVLRGRPPIEVEVCRVKYETWRLFAPFHYMSQDLNHAAATYGLFVGDHIASMCGVLHRPHAKASNIKGFTRMVTLPDWQGLGLAMVLANTVGSAYKALGFRLHSYPNHPAWIRSYMRNQDWVSVKQAGDYSPRRGNTSTVGGFGGKACAVFCYVGRGMEENVARSLVE